MGRVSPMNLINRSYFPVPRFLENIIRSLRKKCPCSEFHSVPIFLLPVYLDTSTRRILKIDQLTIITIRSNLIFHSVFISAFCLEDFLTNIRIFWSWNISRRNAFISFIEIFNLPLIGLNIFFDARILFIFARIFFPYFPFT